MLERLERLHARLARQRGAVVGAEDCRGLGREELLVGPAVELREGTPKRVGGSSVGEHVAAFEVLDPGQARKVLHELLEAPLALAVRSLEREHLARERGEVSQRIERVLVLGVERAIARMRDQPELAAQGVRAAEGRAQHLDHGWLQRFERCPRDHRAGEPGQRPRDGVPAIAEGHAGGARTRQLPCRVHQRRQRLDRVSRHGADEPAQRLVQLARARVIAVRRHSPCASPARAGRRRQRARRHPRVW